jgi:hypothetical protein
VINLNENEVIMIKEKLCECISIHQNIQTNSISNYSTKSESESYIKKTKFEDFSIEYNLFIDQINNLKNCNNSVNLNLFCKNIENDLFKNSKNELINKLVMFKKMNENLINFIKKNNF